MNAEAKSQKATTIILLLGICLCALCALFPPRKFANPSDYRFIEHVGKFSPEIDISHAFLFSQDFGIYSSSSATGTNPNGDLLHYQVEVDGGTLLAELVLIGALTGIVILIPNLSRQMQMGSMPETKAIRAILVTAFFIAIVLAWLFVQ